MRPFLAALLLLTSASPTLADNFDTSNVTYKGSTFYVPNGISFDANTIKPYHDAAYKYVAVLVSKGDQGKTVLFNCAGKFEVLGGTWHPLVHRSALGEVETLVCEVTK